MAQIPQSFIDDVIERNDIESVVGEYVRLDKSSGSNKFGLCPFHNEKTGSFSVNSSRQMYYCFGCHKGGGVINFIMEVENLTYPEAVERLAARAGMQMPQGEEDPRAKHKKRLLALNKDAALFYVEMLGKPQGKRGVEYLRKRNLSPKTVKDFGLGVAPEEYGLLMKAMKVKGYSEQELFDADLIRKSERGGFYDTFRDRLVFPIIDHNRNVLGFSGRDLSDKSKAKYLNSKDTMVYNKRRSLFGLNLARRSKEPYFILVEGNIDVCMLHQAGFDSAVASLGTAFTDEQAKLLSNCKSEIVIAYDGDSAGQSAANKAMTMFSKLDVAVKILKMKGAKDPDEFIKANGAEAFRLLIMGSESPLDFKLNAILAKYPDLSESAAKVEFLEEATNFAATIGKSLEREVYCNRIADLCGIKGETVKAEAEKRRKKLAERNKKNEQQLRNSGPVKLSQPAERKFSYSDISSAKAEEGIIRLLYLFPDIVRNPELPKPEDFTAPVLSKIYGIMLELVGEGVEVSANSLAGRLESNEVSHFVSIVNDPESSGAAALGDYIAKISKRKQETSTTDLMSLSRLMRETKSYKEGE